MQQRNHIRYLKWPGVLGLSVINKHLSHHVAYLNTHFRWPRFQKKYEVTGFTAREDFHELQFSLISDNYIVILLASVSSKSFANFSSLQTQIFIRLLQCLMQYIFILFDTLSPEKPKLHWSASRTHQHERGGCQAPRQAAPLPGVCIVQCCKFFKFGWATWFIFKNWYEMVTTMLEPISTTFCSKFSVTWRAWSSTNVSLWRIFRNCLQFLTILSNCRAWIL